MRLSSLLGRRDRQDPRRRRRGLIAALLAAAVVIGMLCLLWARHTDTFRLPGTPDAALAGRTAAVHFIDVGQGDCLLLEADGRWALIDAGPPDAAGTVVRYLRNHGVQRLDYLMLTHLHADHIGGAVEVLENFTVDAVVLSDMTLGPTPTAATVLRLLETLEARTDIDIILPAPGDRLPLGPGVVEVVDVGIADESNANNTSLALAFCFDTFTFFCAGDVEARYEEILLQNSRLPQDATVYKASHHGSYTSSNDALLARLRPTVAVISCGAGNDYGHPHDVTLARLAAAGAAVYRTDQNGTVVITVCDGVMTVRTERQAA